MIFHMRKSKKHSSAIRKNTRSGARRERQPQDNSFYRNKRILVTGGTGSYGREIVRQLLPANPKEVRVFSRGENAQVEMEREFSDPRLNFYIGDVRDGERLVEVTRGMDIVFHVAALKHVPVGERHIWEFVQTNVAGTRAVIEAVKANGVPRAVFISSDKAADPVNVYGFTKAIAEKMFVTANTHSPETAFLCIRSGNLTGSHGSVVPLFREQIKQRNTITITDRRMTRFLEIPEELSAFVLKMAAQGKGGEIFVPKMAAVDLGTLAEVMVQSLGDSKTGVKYIGVRPGEKFHEVLVSREELGRIIEFPEYFAILPYKFLMDQMPQLSSYAGFSDDHASDKIYSSETAAKLSPEELKEKLRVLGYFSHDNK